jgi:hypothetical protein
MRKFVMKKLQFAAIVFILLIGPLTFGQIWTSTRLGSNNVELLEGDTGEHISWHTNVEEAHERGQKWSMVNDLRPFTTKPAGTIFEPTTWAQSTWPGRNDAIPGDSEPVPDNPPVWNGTPSPNFQDNVVGSYSINTPGPVVDPEGGALSFTVTGCTLPTGVTLDDTNDELDYNGAGTAGTTTSCVLNANDGVNSPVASPSFSIVISDTSAGLCWAEQGAPAYLPYPKNRNGTSCSEVSEGIGYAKAWGGYSQWPGVNPTIIHVTSLANSGAGTLREALTQAATCRVIVFDIGGTITLTAGITASASGCITVNAHTAPGPVWVRLPSVTANPAVMGVAGTDTSFEGFTIEAQPPAACTSKDRALNTPDTTTDMQMLNMALIGGNDVNVSQGRADNYQYIDTLFAQSNGQTLCGSTRNFLNEQGSQRALFLGNVFMTAQGRNPRVLAYTLTAFNSWIYDPGNNAFNLAVDKRVLVGQEPTLIANISDIYVDNGPSFGGMANPISIARSCTVPSGSDTCLGAHANSEIHLNRTRIDSGFCSDAWDAACLNFDLLQTEVEVRDDTTDNFPTGAVPTNTSGLSEADHKLLMTQNNGPRPNDRPADLQAVYDNAIAGTASVQDQYIYTNPPAATTGTVVYDVGASPHADVGSNGYPDLMDQFETERRAFYGN